MGSSDDESKMDFVSSSPYDVGSFNPVTSGQDPPLDPVEEASTTWKSNGLPSATEHAEGELVGDYDAEQSSDEDITEQNMSTRPQRQRRHPGP